MMYTKTKIEMIAISGLVLDLNQPRRNMRNIDRMKHSLQSEGQLNPIFVTQMEDAYVIVDGARRYIAAVALGWKELAAITTTYASAGKVRDVQLTGPRFMYHLL